MITELLNISNLNPSSVGKVSVAKMSTRELRQNKLSLLEWCIHQGYAAISPLVRRPNGPQALKALKRRQGCLVTKLARFLAEAGGFKFTGLVEIKGLPSPFQVELPKSGLGAASTN